MVACTKLKLDSTYKDGFNLIGFSQGGMIARWVLQYCSMGEKVHNFITFGSPHGGQSGIPDCTNGFFCPILEWLANRFVYWSIA